MWNFAIEFRIFYFILKIAIAFKKKKNFFKGTQYMMLCMAVYNIIQCIERNVLR